MFHCKFSRRGIRFSGTRTSPHRPRANHFNARFAAHGANETGQGGHSAQELQGFALD